MNYSVNWIRYIKERVMDIASQAKHLALIKAFLAPVISLHASFLLFINRIDYEINVTPQVRILRARLNSKFDPDDRRFEILDGETFAITYIFLESENEPVYLPTFIGGFQYDFIVNVPTELMSLESQIKGFIDQFKLAGKTYQIRYI